MLLLAAVGCEPSAAPYAAWQRIQSAPVPHRESGVAVVEGKLYIFGGFTSRDAEVTDQVQVYDPSTNQWARLRPMPAPFTHANAVQVGDTIWFAGGFVGNDPGWATDTVWRYHPPTDKWTPGPSLPAPRAGGTLSLVGENLH